jgi:hypothetical protein
MRIEMRWGLKCDTILKPAESQPPQPLGLELWSAGGDKSTRIRVCEEEWGFLKRIGLFVRKSGLLRRGGEVGGSGEVELSEEG